MTAKKFIFYLGTPLVASVVLMILLSSIPGIKQLPTLEEKARSGNVKAMIELAQKYDYDWSHVDNHKEKAMKWYQKAAKAGNLESTYKIGMRYLNGDGVTQDEHRAACWLEKAAQKGHERAQGTLEQLKKRHIFPTRNSSRLTPGKRATVDLKAAP